MSAPTLEVSFSPTTGPFAAPTWILLSEGGPHGNRVLGAEWEDGKKADLEQYPAGEATIVLTNHDRLFDPEHASGTYYGDLNPRVPFRLRSVMPCLDLDGASWGRVEDHASLDITGDLELAIWLTMDDWTPTGGNYLLSKSAGFAASGGYWWSISATGFLILAWSDGASVLSRTSTSAVSFTNATPGWIKVTLDVNNGAGGHDVKFWTSTDGVTWTQLGTTVTTAGVTSIGANTTALLIGANGFGLAPLLGQVHRTTVRNGIGGTAVLDIPFYAQDLGDTSFLDAVGRNVLTQINAVIDDVGVVTDLFYGFVEEGWEQTYMPPGDATATVKLVDLIAVISQFRLPSVLATAILAESPDGYWPLADTAGTGIEGIVGPDGIYSPGVTGTTASASAGGATLIGQRFGNDLLTAHVPVSPTDASATMVMCVVDALDMTLVYPRIHELISLGEGPGGESYMFGIQITDVAARRARLVRAPLPIAGSNVSIEFTIPSGAFHLAWIFDLINNDDVPHFNGDVLTSGGVTYAPIGAVDGLKIGTGKVGGVAWPAYISDVAWWDSVNLSLDVPTIAAAAISPLDGLRSDEQIAWALDTIGVPSSMYDLDVGSSIMGPANTAGRNALEFIRAVTDTEQGGFYVDHANGGKLHLRRRYASFLDTRATTAMATFSDDPAALDTEAARPIPGRLRVDPNGVATVINQANVEWQGGTVTVDESAGSPYGPRPVSIRSAAPSPDVARGIGAWTIALNATPAARIRELGINPGANPVENATAVLTRIGDRVNYRAKPQDAGAATTKALEVLGRKHRVTDVEWETSYYLTASVSAIVGLFILDDSLLDGTDVLAY